MNEPFFYLNDILSCIFHMLAHKQVCRKTCHFNDFSETHYSDSKLTSLYSCSVLILITVLCILNISLWLLVKLYTCNFFVYVRYNKSHKAYNFSSYLCLSALLITAKLILNTNIKIQQLFLQNAVCLAGKHQIPIVTSLVSPSQELNPITR